MRRTREIAFRWSPSVSAALLLGLLPGPSGGCATPEAALDAARSGGTPAAARLSDLAWLVGSWQSSGREITRERWEPATGRWMLGSGGSFDQGSLTFFEFLALEEGVGGVVYRAWPSGGAPTDFALTRLEGQSAVFENPDHDFPRRLEYQRVGQRLQVRASGREARGPRVESWSMSLADANAEPARPVAALRLERVVPAAQDTVWEAWSTTAGVQTFFSPAARVEGRLGGAYEMYFDASQPAGRRGSEGCVIVEWVPPRRLAFSWNFPPRLAGIRDEHTLVVIELTAVDPTHTKVSLEQVGFRAGAEWEQGRAYFERAWGVVLERLEQRFAKGPLAFGAGP